MEVHFNLVTSIIVNPKRHKSSLVCGLIYVSTFPFGIVKNYFGLYGQVTKRARWMPWQSEAMKDVVICEKVRGVDKQTVIRTCPNGETHSTCRVSHSEYIAVWRRTRGTETSKYPEEKKSTEIP